MNAKEGFGLRILVLAVLLMTLVLGGCATTARDTDTLHQV